MASFKQLISIDEDQAAAFKSNGEKLALEVLDRVSRTITKDMDLTNDAQYYAVTAAIDHTLQALIDKLLEEQKEMQSTPGYRSTLKIFGTMDHGRV